MSSREQFEQAMKGKFDDLIDYRVCKNGDGEYMAWDMQVAWFAWQAATSAMEAKCAALAEKGMEVVREASLVYSKYNDTQMPDRDIVDQQTLQELYELCAAKLRQDANTAELVAAGIITRIEG